MRNEIGQSLVVGARFVHLPLFRRVFQFVFNLLNETPQQLTSFAAKCATTNGGLPSFSPLPSSLAVLKKDTHNRTTAQPHNRTTAQPHSRTDAQPLPLLPLSTSARIALHSPYGRVLTCTQATFAFSLAHEQRSHSHLYTSNVRILTAALLPPFGSVGGIAPRAQLPNRAD
jgi:hypothetical protein